ncbi:hypothetical protein ATI14_0029 [Pseudomonas tolaasii NCPPB 2192]|uniref:DUF5132 domain-containing protein n=1 Tax=Pseudomonas tolaasii NCPPB 2192 TaxID=564423 RepID=A0ABX4Q995_PSETO|nr:hypothetical protein ATI14_0029 [Pseudomonas tolaasii NCPPB 2192]
MSIGALAALPLVGDLAKAALPVVGEFAKTATELVKVAGEVVKSISAQQQSAATQTKVAQENTHSHDKPVDFSNGNSASSNVSIHFS